MKEIKYSFKGNEIAFLKDKNVMINATEMAKPFGHGKEPSYWLKTEQAKNIINAISTSRNIEVADLVRVTNGGNTGNGTWMQEDVALVFAQWLSPEFYIWCNDHIKELLTQGTTSILPKDYLSALKALVVAEEEKQRLSAENETMKPKAAYFDNLVERKLLTNFRDTAKEFGVQQKEFIDTLLNDGYIYRDKKGNIKPYAKYTPELFEIKDYKSLDGKHVGQQTLITPKGKVTFELLIKPQISVNNDTI